MRAFAAIPIFLLAGSLIAASDAYRDAQIRSGPNPGVRLASGLAICDEALISGRWVNRYWQSTGVIKAEAQLEDEVHARDGLPVDAFQLAIDGQDLGGSWKLERAQATPQASSSALLVTVELASTSRPISVRVNTLLYGGPVMVRWLEITNKGNRAAGITRVSPWAGSLWDTEGYKERLTRGDEQPFRIAHAEFQDWGYEGAWRFDPLGLGTLTFAGTRGRSGWGHPTFFAQNRATGEWFVVSLGWSSNWTANLRAVQDDKRMRAQLFFDLGPSAVDPVLRVIDPGETVRTPDTHLLLSRGDLDIVIQAMHDHVRRNVLPAPVPGRAYQVESNHRGYIVNHEDEPGMKREIDIAAEAGAEMFLIDAGWFGPEPNEWWKNVGDWYAGKWLPNDLTPIREYARGKGLLFGLWVEIESIGASSNLRKAHPDWVLTRNGKPVAEGRHLDFANPRVAAWAESEIARIIRKYDLDMFRLDYNTVVEEGGNRMKDGFLENTEWRHVEAIYAMFDRLRAQFPRVIFQNCAGGGGRLDLGIMRRFHNTELSDWLRAPRGLKVMNGMTWVLPPEILLRTFGTEAEAIDEDGDLDLQLRTAMLSRPIFRGIAPTREELNPIVRRHIQDSVDLFKRTVRPIMIDSRVYHHTPVTPMMEQSPWVVLEYAAVDRARAVVGLFRTSSLGNDTFLFTPRGLDFGRTYRVQFGNTGQTVELPGAELLQRGIPVRLENALTSELLLFEAK